MRVLSRLAFSLYKAALLLYPRRLRLRYRPEMLQSLRDAHNDRRNGFWSFWLRMFNDLLCSACMEQSLMLSQQIMKRPICFHTATLGLLLTVLGGVGTLQLRQMIRHGANQPQIEMAHFYSSEIGGGSAPDDSIPPGYVDPERNLEPFVIFYDDEGRAVVSTGYIDQNIPMPPASIFEHVRREGSYSFTWRPRPDVRIAAVAERVSGSHNGMVLAGRSLQVTERDERTLYNIALVSWVILVTILITAAFFLKHFQRRDLAHPGH